MGVTVTLFTVAMTWTSLRIALTVEWIKKIWCIYTYNTVEYYSGIKKNGVRSSAATWMDLEIVILSKVSQRQI